MGKRTRPGLLRGWAGLLAPAGCMMVGGATMGWALERSLWGGALFGLAVVVVWTLALREAVERRVRQERMATLEEVQGWRDEIADMRQEAEHASR